jgi:hypothetical protein
MSVSPEGGVLIPGATTARRVAISRLLNVLLVSAQTTAKR